MLSSAVRILFGRSTPSPAGHASTAPLAETLPPIEVVHTSSTVPISWPAARLALTHDLWGDGFIFPGGEPEILRLARPLGMSSAASLLIVGAGSGGPASSVTRNFGAWITGLEHDPSLLAAAKRLTTQSKLDKKIALKPWDPDNPDFGSKCYHHCLALEPLHGAHPEPILDALARAVRAGGQIVITALGAELPLDLNDPTVRRWGELERRDPAHVPAPVAITRMLARVGLDVRVAEDISDRHVEQALLGWRTMLRNLGTGTPTRPQAAQLVREAELWLLRRRLIRGGQLRMMRWHAISHPRDYEALPATNGLSTA